VRGQLLEVSDRIMGTLTASYSGDEAVRSSQTMLFRNVTKIIAGTQEIVSVRIAAVVLEELRNSPEIQQSNFVILDVVCLGYIPKPSPATQARGMPLFKTRYRGLRRQLEQKIGGDLEVNIEITGEYSTARRDEVSADVDFNDLTEVSACVVYLEFCTEMHETHKALFLRLSIATKDSINRVGNNIGATLKERDVLVMEGEVTSQTVVITLVPTPTPIEPKSIAPPPITTKSNFASSSIGITGIVTVALVVFVVAGFLFYRALRSRKIDNKDMSWVEDDFSDSYQKNTNQKNTKEAHNVVEAMPTPRTFKVDDPPNVRPAHYSGSKTSVSGPPVDSLDALPAHYAPVRLSGIHGAFQPLDRGLKQTVAEDRQNLVHDEEQIKYDKVASRRSQRQLDDFETRVQKSRSDRLNKKLGDGHLLSSDGSVSSFEDRLKQKLSGSNYSSRHLEDFEACLADKIKEGESSRSTQGVHSSSSSSEDFDARMKKKLSNSNPRRSPGRSASSYEDRLKQKLSNSIVPPEERPVAKIKGGEARRSTQDTFLSLSSSEDFESRLAAKIKKGESSRSTRGVYPSSSSSEDFDARMKKKLSDSNPRRSPGRSTSSYEDRLKQKLSNSIVLSRSRENSEERPVAKIKGGEASRSAQGFLSSLSSSEDFESRLVAKIKKGERNRSRDECSGTGLAFEDRLTKKLGGSNVQSSGGSVSSFEDRLKQKLSDSNDSSRHVEDFEARLAAKIKEGESSRSTQGVHPSSSSFEDFDALMQKKLSNSNPMRSPGRSASSYEDRLKQKLSNSIVPPRSRENSEERPVAKIKGGKASRSTHDTFPSLSSSEDFESRLAAKIKKGERNRSRDASSGTGLALEDRLTKKLGGSNEQSSGGSVSSFEDRLKQKLSDSNDSSRHVEDFEARLAAKIKEGEKNKSSDGPILSYEDRLEKKLNEGHTRKISGGSLSSFEDKLKNKLLGSSLATPLSSSPGDLNYSTRISDSFEERIAAKMKEGEKHTKSTSGALPSYSSSLTVKEFEARLAAKIKKTSREESPSASNLSYNRSGRRRTPRGTTSSAASFR
jgi:hypothetical protein